MGINLKNLDFQICKFNIALFLRAVLLLQPVILFFYNENNLSVQDLFFFQGIFYLVSILSEIPVGYLSDNISRKKLLIISFLIFLFITVLWLFFKGYYVILAGEILFAISKVMMDNANSGYLYDYLENKNMVKYWGYLNFYLAFGTAVAAIIGTFLYQHYGSEFILITETVLISISILLVITLPDIKSEAQKSLNDLSLVKDFKNKIEDFKNSVKNIYSKTEMRHYIFYSGLLSSLSILFAVSFQPLMQHAMFPVALFGVVAFINHGIRALSGVVAGKFLRSLNIRKMIIPLYALYFVAFFCVFKMISVTNVKLTFALLFVICLIIGVQLSFTILHVSRLHKFVSIDYRGSLMSVNNFVSRTLAAIILMSSKLFIGPIGLKAFFMIAFACFVVFGSLSMVNAYKVKE
ncbi:MFS transporter [bacterium]|nr:MFS transporter [bacterium]